MQRRDYSPATFYWRSSISPKGGASTLRILAQAQLERSLNIDVYNFGVAMYVGPVQYYLIYRQLASKFEHDGLVLFFLPANDFTDNDFELWKNLLPHLVSTVL